MAVQRVPLAHTLISLSLLKVEDLELDPFAIIECELLPRRYRPRRHEANQRYALSSIAASSLKCETNPTYGCRAPPVMPAPTLAAGECTDILREPLLNEIPPSAGSDAFDSLAFSGDGASAV